CSEQGTVSLAFNVTGLPSDIDMTCSGTEKAVRRHIGTLDQSTIGGWWASNAAPETSVIVWLINTDS
ncbi:MAG: hypothetical protein LBB54_00565, partial [Cellulomonadaceae bacterium]|nr:hypothetical protein [Cellulomonadaceae bacterium]